MANGWTAAHGVLLYVVPKAIDSMYGVPEREPYVIFQRRNWGSQMLIGATATSGMLYGLGDLEVVAFGWTVAFVGLIGLMKDIFKYSTDMTGLGFWLLLEAFVAIVLMV